MDGKLIDLGNGLHLDVGEANKRGGFSVEPLQWRGKSTLEIQGVCLAISADAARAIREAIEPTPIGRLARGEVVEFRTRGFARVALGLPDRAEVILDEAGVNWMRVYFGVIREQESRATIMHSVFRVTREDAAAEAVRLAGKLGYEVAP